MAAVIETIRQRHPGEKVSLSNSVSVLDDVVNDATARIDLGKLTQVIETTKRWYGNLDLDEDQLERDSSRFARMLLAYNKAYFGDLSFTVRPAHRGAGLRGVAKVTSKRFVDRSGNVLLFPGITKDLEESPADSARISKARVDSQRVRADLIRISLKAFFDAAIRIPAVHGATALRVGQNSQEPPCPEFDADHPAISLRALARVTRDAMRAEAVVTSLIGKAVRGGNVFGPQNEVLAATLEAAAEVIAKNSSSTKGSAISG